ncbi:hypothetical protein ACHHYP_11568 [Achlya hypogyna]|uniref:FYVE-type domain-containing protein n=1 Tax=Achlya hypogyna TaxID=1202772 RepID=A0A1V9ZHR4_ACHHY|nr:hypothetical protein ACHHYP_11568 [Achlya hypogyna]
MSKFPVPPTFFQCPPLTPSEVEFVTTLGRQSLADLIDVARVDGGTMHWTLTSDDNGVQLYVGGDGDEESALFCSVTEVLATIDEAAGLFRLDTSTAFKAYARNFAKDLLDSVSLYTLAKSTLARPHHYIGVKWIAYESPYPMVANRDFCYLECQDDFSLSNGKRGWARSFRSITLPCCPDLKHSLGLVRATFQRAGFVFVEANRPGYLRVIHILQMHLGGRVPRFIVRAGMKRRARAIADIDTFLRQQRLSQATCLHEYELIPVASRSKCFLCHTKFGAFATKRNCRICGEVVCRNCAQQWDVPAARGRKLLRYYCLHRSPG